MNRLRGFLLSTSLLLSTSAVASVQTLEVAAPNGRGNIDVGLEAGGARFRSGSYGLTAGELTLGYGVNDRDTVTARFGIVSGYELGVKHTFRFDAAPRFLLAADGRAGLHWSTAAVPLLDANVGVIAQWSPFPALHVLASPRLLLSSAGTALWVDPVNLEENGERATFSTVNSDAALIPAATLGLAVDVGASVRVVGEAGCIFAPVLDSRGSDGSPALLRGVSAALAIQWTPPELDAR